MPSENATFFSADDTGTVRRCLARGRDRLLGRRRQRIGLRGVLLCVFSAPLAIAAVVALASGNVTAFAGSVVALALIGGCAHLNRRHLLGWSAAPSRRYTRPVHFPHRYAAVILAATDASRANARVPVGRTIPSIHNHP